MSVDGNIRKYWRLAGERDGRADALAGRWYRPLPKLSLSVMSSGYQTTYMDGYAQAYLDTKYAKTRQDVQDNRRKLERVKANRDREIERKNKIENRSQGR